MFTVTCHLIVGKITVNSEETHSVGSRSMFYFAFEYVHLIICTDYRSFEMQSNAPHSTCSNVQQIAFKITPKNIFVRVIGAFLIQFSHDIRFQWTRAIFMRSRFPSFLLLSPVQVRSHASVLEATTQLLRDKKEQVPHEFLRGTNLRNSNFFFSI